MAKGKQFNYYVNPEEDKELYDFLQSLTKMTRSAFIKTLIKQYIANNGTMDWVVFRREENKPVQSPQSLILRLAKDHDLNDDDLL